MPTEIDRTARRQVHGVKQRKRKHDRDTPQELKLELIQRYLDLSLEQAEHAVMICESIIAGSADLADLNRQSLAWRGKLRAAENRGK